jgi:hypothetical protein
MAKNNHYTPEFLLHRFIDGDGGLWQLNKSTGKCERRNPSKAGMLRGLYLDELEDGYLQQIDGAAASILQASVYDRDVVTLTDENRDRLAEFFATLVHRNPKNLVNAEEFVARATADPSSVIDPDVNYGVEYANMFQAEHPDVWREQIEYIKTEEVLQEAIAEVGAEEVLRQVVIRMVNEDVKNGNLTRGSDDPKVIFNKLISPTRSADWADWILKYHWSWWRTEGEFIIGDDPVCRWSPKLKHVEYGVGHADCEVTIPLSRKLCLVLKQTPCDAPCVVKFCGRSTTAMYNNRQWLATSRFMYGSRNQVAREKWRWDDVAAGRIRYPKGGD